MAHSEDEMENLDKRVEIVTLADWSGWEMRSPTYKMQGTEIEIKSDPGARTFSRGDQEIRVHHFWNGASSFRPEEPKQWPGITIRLRFGAEQYALQREVVGRIKKLIEETFNGKGD